MYPKLVNYNFKTARCSLTDALGLAAVLSEESRLADALVGLVAVAVLAIPVRDALGAVLSLPAVAAPAGIRHHAEALEQIFSQNHSGKWHRPLNKF